MERENHNTNNYLSAIPHTRHLSVAYTAQEVKYSWLSGTDPVGLEKGLQMSQFDLQETFSRELNFTRSESVGSFSVLQVVFLLQRHTGYFLIQVRSLEVPTSLSLIITRSTFPAPSSWSSPGWGFG